MPRGIPNPRPDKIEENPEVPEAPVAPVESVETEATDPCWNCGKQLTDGTCAACGFDKSLIYNLDLEAKIAVERQKAQQAQQASNKGV
jgi:ribosomal protein L37E